MSENVQFYVNITWFLYRSLSGERNWLMWQNIRLDYLSVCWSVCLQNVLWQNGWVDPYAVWDGEWGRSSDGCITVLDGGGEFLVIHCNQ